MKKLNFKSSLPNLHSFAFFDQLPTRGRFWICWYAFYLHAKCQLMFVCEWWCWKNYNLWYCLWSHPNWQQNSEYLCAWCDQRAFRKQNAYVSWCQCHWNMIVQYGLSSMVKVLTFEAKTDTRFEPWCDKPFLAISNAAF